jgi:TM2 domain-containing membrane protein YozV
MTTEHNTHSKLIGYVLWIVGFTGAHRFYYGKPITGTIWFFTGGLLLIGWIVDLFLIPGMDRKADIKNAPGARDHSLAWLLLVFGGWLGLHRFYLHKWFSGFAIVIMTALTAVLFPVFFFLLLPLGIMLLVDLWTLNAQVSEFNRRHYTGNLAGQPA